MRKLLLLIPLIFLCSCGTKNDNIALKVNNDETSVMAINDENSTTSNQEQVSYQKYNRRDENYIYVFYVDYEHEGELIVARTDITKIVEEYVIYKTFNNYVVVYDDKQHYCLYDYGDFAIWVTHYPNPYPYPYED